MLLYQNVQVTQERVVLATACVTTGCLGVECVHVVQISRDSPARRASLTTALMVRCYIVCI